MPAVIDEHHQFTVNGKPIVNGRVYIGEANKDPKLNPITIYSDRILTLPIANPQSIDSDGRTLNKIWIPGEYSLLIEDEDNVQRYQNLDLGEPTGASAGITTLNNVQGTNNLTADAANTIVAYADNETYTFRAANSNTGAMTLDIDGIGPKGIIKGNNIDLALGDVGQNQTLVTVYNAITDKFQLLNPGRPKTNPNASVDPTVNNDITEGYTVDSTWTNVNNNISYICLDNNAATAIWRVTGGILDNLSASAAPALTDDLDLGYKPGSLWVDTTNERAYINLNNTNNAASWLILNSLSTDEAFWPKVSLAADTDHDITFSAGAIPDSTGTQVIRLPSNITKQSDVVWAEGSDVGGFPSSINGGNVEASTTYHYFVIAKPDGTVDAGFDTSLTATNLLADATDYTLYRRVGSMMTDGSSNWLSFVQTGRDFTLGTRISNFSNVAPPTTPTLRTISVPTGIKVKAKANVALAAKYDFVSAGGASYGYLQVSDGNLSSGMSAGTGDLVANTFTSEGVGALAGDVDYDTVSAQIEVYVNTSSQIYIDSAVDTAAGGLNATTLEYALGVSGWIDELIN